MAEDQAPVSSRRVRATLIRNGVSEEVVDSIAVVTAVDRHRRAVTTVERFGAGQLGPAAQQEVDRAFARAFKALPGFNGSYTITMGRTFEVEWTGVCAPV